MRRANHDKVAAPTLTTCTNCGETTRPHRVCAACGFYGGVAVIAKASPSDANSAQS